MKKIAKASSRAKHGGRRRNAEHLIACADFCIRRGWKVFLLAPGTRLPLAGTHGPLDATDDLDVIRKLAKKHPDANLAVATGVVSDLTVVDIDRHDGDGFDT